ncbi:hypothetical protein ACFPES_02435 [Paenibacillus sp. GCM10023248]|uniref:hypothetical protein n=1 Tax=Bacillales TaxID=1385 RepID=UPI002377DFAD|nr:MULTISPECIES: hypothetical protein [Bacillales]MDD9265882.1 hypothetical protein [Paenibacillus sp. MAHUQ-63]MDR6879121.1 hypothetical protein [Bacillus sp. 3255]
MKQLAILLIGLTILLSGCGRASSLQEGMEMPGMAGMAGAGSAHAHSSDAIAHFAVTADRYIPNEEATITILIQDKWNKPIDAFDVVHEKLMHVIVVSRDLAYFEHLHPEHTGKGQFEVRTKFPANGYYQLIADFTPQGMGETVQTHWVTIGGGSKDTKPPSLKPDTSLAKVVQGRQVTLAFDHLMAGMDLDMVFTIKDAETKQGITDLQPYLGSLGHVVAISADGSDYVHVHPNDQTGSGPVAAFKINFPKSGIYKIWGQFQHRGEVLIVPYIVQVP